MNTTNGYDHSDDKNKVWIQSQNNFAFLPEVTKMDGGTIYTTHAIQGFYFISTKSPNVNYKRNTLYFKAKTYAK
jgi:hypothetical protein